MHRLIIFVLLFAAVFAGLARSQAPRFSEEDLQRLTGARWRGTLTYTDYRSAKKVSIPSELTVTQAEGQGRAWLFEYVYPAEPKANGRRTVTLGEGGGVFDSEKVVERTGNGDGVVVIVTEKRGKDNDKDALFRFTYTFGGSSFSIRKEVRPEGAAEFFERNRYSWER